MLLSINWLKDFVKLPKNISPQDLRDKLTAHTVEVEGIIDLASQYNQVVVGKVLSVEKHPQADRLRLTKVDVKSAVLDIVCGADNVAAGQLVPVALPGAILPNGLEIKETEIRGLKSQGMICAEDELGLGDNHDGIMVLEKAKLGQDFSSYLNSSDIILEIDNKSLSNRSDLWGQYGLAREVATILDIKLRPYQEFIKNDFDIKKSNKLSVKVENRDDCPVYQATLINNVKVEQSPEWLKNRLLAVGLRPLNNIVDLTNYVMWELGQPLHAFSGEGIKEISVRRSRRQESLITLDGAERSLPEDSLLITSSNKPLAIAGVIGGLDSGIKEDTSSIILEAANFDAILIRKTSTALGLRTEASMRFEKGLDPNFCDLARLRFLTLLQKMCPEIEIEGIAISSSDVNLNIGPIVFSHDWLSKKLGMKLEKKKIINILEKLGFISTFSHGELSVSIPTWRAVKDVSSKEDILEEVARIYGYNNIPTVWPIVELKPPLSIMENELERQVQDILAKENNFSETCNYSFVSEALLSKINLDWTSNLRLVNPISEQHTMLRQSLLPGLISNIKTNQFNYEQIALFEIGRVFKALGGTISKTGGEEALPYQDKRLALIFADNNQDPFVYLKGRLNNFILSLLGPDNELKFNLVETPPAWADNNNVAKLSIGAVELGLVAKLHPSSVSALGLKKDCAIAEIDWRTLHDLFIMRKKKYREPARFPALSRDLAFVLPQKVLYNEIKDEISGFHELISSVELFDVYSGDKLDNNLKSLAFHVNYQSPTRTLLASEVDLIQEKLVANLKDKFGAKLRDY